jgi:hypothetical protein
MPIRRITVKLWILQNGECLTCGKPGGGNTCFSPFDGVYLVHPLQYAIRLPSQMLIHTEAVDG